MDFKEVCEQMHKFEGVRVERINQTVNKAGLVDGTLEAVCYGECNLPKTLLDCATNVTQSMEMTPIQIAGNLQVAQIHAGPTKYEITFKYDRIFLYHLKDAYKKEQWRQVNAEMDEFIEKWLGEDEQAPT